MPDLSSYPVPCTIRHFEIEAISLPIVYNKYGDHDPNGLLYVLRQDSKDIQQMQSQIFNSHLLSPMKKYSPLSSGPMLAIKSM